MDQIDQHQYHLRMIDFILARLDEDEVLARGMPNERLHRLAINSRGARDGIRDYQQAAAKTFDAANRLSTVWWWSPGITLSPAEWVGVYRG